MHNRSHYRLSESIAFINYGAVIYSLTSSDGLAISQYVQSLIIRVILIVEKKKQIPAIELLCITNLLGFALVETYISIKCSWIYRSPLNDSSSEVRRYCQSDKVTQTRHTKQKHTGCRHDKPWECSLYMWRPPLKMSNYMWCMFIYWHTLVEMNITGRFDNKRLFWYWQDTISLV